MNKPPEPPIFEITDYKPIDGRGCLRAFFAIRIRGIKIRGCRVVQEPGKKMFIQGPQRQWEHNGQTRYEPLVEFTDAQRAYIENAVRTYYDLQVSGQLKPRAEKGDAA